MGAPRASAQGPALERVAAEARPAVVLVQVTTHFGETSGTGFVVDPFGSIVTSHHVVDLATSIMVRLASGVAFSGVKVRAADPASDLALLDVPGFGLPALPLGSSRSLRTRDPVVLLTADARGRRASSGTVRGWKRVERGGLRVIETDVRAGPGASGAPLLGTDGRVVGVLTFRVKWSRRSQLAVPVERVTALLSRARGPATLEENRPWRAERAAPES